MEEQTGKNTTPPKTKKSKGLYVVVALVIFVAAVFIIAKVTSNNDNQKNTKTAKVAQVRITAKGFEPATIVVDQGTKIIWTNTDSKLHQVASNPYPKDNGLAGLKSEILNNNQAYQYTANKTGTFGYHDEITPTVNGTLVVKK